MTGNDVMGRFDKIVLFSLIGGLGTAFILIMIYFSLHPYTEQDRFRDCVSAYDNHTMIVFNSDGCRLNLTKGGWRLDGLQGNDGFFSHSYLVYRR